MHPARRLTPSTLRSFVSHAVRRQQHPAKPAVDHSASAKLFADAAHEEALEAQQPAAKRARTPNALLSEHENWTGDESVRDAVLRMLVDKYRPLRGDFRSADDKLRRAPPAVSTRALEDDERSLVEYLADPASIPPLPEAPSLDGSTATTPSSGEAPTTAPPALTIAPAPTIAPASSLPPPPSGALANVPLLPATPGHQPWHTTFKAPSHAASVRAGTFPARAPTRPPAAAAPDDERARRKAAEARRRSAHAVRLTNARESTLDYRLGLRGAGDGGGAPASAQRAGPAHGAPNPVSIRAWAGLVEERIEKARREGRFSNLSGRGRPIERATEEHNPFIAREEFLMNRIVQRQGAAPPWVEVQGELDAAVNSFRAVLLEAWTRRALRNLTLSTPAPALPAVLRGMTLDSARALRDDAWAARERSYHEHAVGELNALVRKYNGLAPYAVRRTYYAREAELARAYEAGGEAVLRGLEERVRGGGAGVGEIRVSDEEGDGVVRGGKPVEVLTVRDVLRGWLKKWTGG